MQSACRRAGGQQAHGSLPMALASANSLEVVRVCPILPQSMVSVTPESTHYSTYCFKTVPFLIATCLCIRKGLERPKDALSHPSTWQLIHLEGTLVPGSSEPLASSSTRWRH